MSQPTGTQSGTAGTDPAQSGQGNEGGQGSQQSQGSGTQSGAEGQTGQQSPEVVSRSDFEAIQRQLQAADRKRNEAEQALQAKERESMDEHERTKAELADAQRVLEAQKELNRKLSLENAFLQDNTFKWRNPKAAMRLADLSGVEVKEDGSVTGLKVALEALAKSEPYLLEATGEPEGQTGPQKQPPAKSAPPMNNGGGGAGSDRTSLESRFPQLRGRV